MKLTGPKVTIRRAQSLRRAMSLPERILWRSLRKKQTGMRFRRQHPAGPYVLDFYCHEARLCVELDGAAHNFTNGRDVARDRWLAGQGVRTVRIAAGDVFRNLDGVIDFIVSSGRPPPSAAPTPPPEVEDAKCTR